MDDDEHDVAQPAAFDADTTAKALGLSQLQFKWAMATLRGCNKTRAAEAAGYTGTPEQLRSVGHRVSRSAKVTRFLELAVLEGGEVIDRLMDATERLRILSRTARGSDKNAAIRAIEVLHRMDEAQREAEAREASMADPGDILLKMGQMGPLGFITALASARVHDVPLPSEIWATATPDCKPALRKAIDVLTDALVKLEAIDPNNRTVIRTARDPRNLA